MKKIYRLEIVQADDDWFHVRRYPKFDVGTSYQLLYYSMEEIEAYIKLAIEKDAFADLICFIVYEHVMGELNESPCLHVYDQFGKKAMANMFQRGDIVDVLGNDEIILGVITEVENESYEVMIKAGQKGLRHTDKEHAFLPHYKIPIRTEQRLRKLYTRYVENKIVK